jgi:hypothetical protein
MLILSIMPFMLGEMLIILGIALIIQEKIYIRLATP